MPVLESPNTSPSSRATERGVAPHNAVTPIQGEIADLPSQSAHSLPSIRGMLGDHRLSNFDRVVRGHSFSQEQLGQLAEIWTKARMDPRSDEGALLRQLLPTLQAHPELLTQLHRVATSDHLFGRDKSDPNFEQMRREFLSDLIRGAVDSRNITQGPGAMCTAASMLKAVPATELIRLSCGFALDGRVTTAGGKDMMMRPEFFRRAEISSNAAMEDIRCRRPSAGMLMVLDGVIELGVPDTTQQSGSYWWQYTDAWRNLRGHESACAGRDATIHVNSSGQALHNAPPGARTVTQMGYLLESLNQPDARVLIDTQWNHSSSSTGMSAEHGRHMLVARSTVTRDGVQYVMCENPIGDFVDTSKSSRGHAEYFPPGTVLGNRNGFWFETAENGMVLIRRDVMESHLQTVLVDYQDRYVTGTSGRPIALGTLSTDAVSPITFVRGDDPAKRADSTQEATLHKEREGHLLADPSVTSSKASTDTGKGGSRAVASKRRKGGGSEQEDSVWDPETESWSTTRQDKDPHEERRSFEMSSLQSSGVAGAKGGETATGMNEDHETTGPSSGPTPSFFRDPPVRREGASAATRAISYGSSAWGKAFQPVAEEPPALTPRTEQNTSSMVTEERIPANEASPLSSETKTIPQGSSFLTSSLFGKDR